MWSAHINSFNFFLFDATQFVELLARRGLESSEWTWHERVHICSQLSHLRVPEKDYEAHSEPPLEANTGKVAAPKKSLPDFIGRFEALADGEAAIRLALGLSTVSESPLGPGKIPHKNRQEREPYQSYYPNARTRELVYSVYKEYIDFFGYSF